MPRPWARREDAGGFEAEGTGHDVRGSSGDIAVRADGGDIDAITGATHNIESIHRSHQPCPQGRKHHTAMKAVAQYLLDGIVKRNPTFVLVLGMCPTLGTTSSAPHGVSMGLATMAVLTCSNAAISAIKNVVPQMVRIPVFYRCDSLFFVTILQMLMQAGHRRSMPRWASSYRSLWLTAYPRPCRGLRLEAFGASVGSRRHRHRRGLFAWLLRS